MIVVELLILILSSILVFVHRSFILKLILLIVLYPALILVLFRNGVLMPGTLEFNRNFFSEDVLVYADFYYLIGLLIFNVVLWPYRNRIYSFRPIRLGLTTRFVLFVFFCLSSIPVFNIHNADANIKSATFYLVFSVILILTTSKKDIVWWGQLFVLLFVILNGERVDSLLSSVFLFIMVWNRKGNAEILKRGKIYIGCFFFFFLLVAVGFFRNDDELSYQLLLKALYSQQTVCDVVYIYLTGVSYFFESGSNPTVLYNLLGGLIPGPTSGVSSMFYYGNILHQYMPNPGGGLFITEGMLWAGGIGVLLYFYLYGVLLKFLFSGQSLYKKSIFILFVVMQCRIVWYGLIYTYKPILLLLVFSMIIRKMSFKSKINGLKCNYSK